MKDKLLTIILGIFLLVIAPLVSADSIGRFDLNETFQITNYCSSADCTFMNLTSITLPSGSVVYYNVEMTQNIQEFNFTYAGETYGTYSFMTCADPKGIDWCEVDSFEVEKEELTIGKSFAYIGLIFFLFAIFILCLVAIFRVENFIGRFVLFWITFLMFFAITFICFQVTDTYFTNVEFLGTFFWILYWIMLIGTIPLFLSSMAYLFYIVAYNDHFKKLVEKGATPEEAFKINDKKLNPFKNERR